MTSNFSHLYQGTILWDSSPVSSVCAYGAFTLFGEPFQATSASLERKRPGPQPYIRHTFPYGVQFGLFPFRSPLLRESQLVSFPPLTKMFQFRGFPLLFGAPQSPLGVRGEKSHSGIPGSTLACSYPGRFAACRALLQCSSLVIHQTALHVELNWLFWCLFSVWSVLVFAWCSL